MSLLSAMQNTIYEHRRLIGPGRLMLVVGPSGAGKDTLINLARADCCDDTDVVFPRRVVTRASGESEDHDSLTHDAFDRAARDGAFALHWEAHGLKYGIPKSIDDDIRAERTVVCNVSRTIVEAARRRYRCALALLVTAPADVLAQRLSARGRTSDGSIADRINRSASAGDGLRADFVIETVTAPQMSADKLVALIRSRNFVLLS